MNTTESASVIFRKNKMEIIKVKMGTSQSAEKLTGQLVAKLATAKAPTSPSKSIEENIDDLKNFIINTIKDFAESNIKNLNKDKNLPLNQQDQFIDLGKVFPLSQVLEVGPASTKKTFLYTVTESANVLTAVLICFDATMTYIRYDRLSEIRSKLDKEIEEATEQHAETKQRGHSHQNDLMSRAFQRDPQLALKKREIRNRYRPLEIQVNHDCSHGKPGALKEIFEFLFSSPEAKRFVLGNGNPKIIVDALLQTFKVTSNDTPAEQQQLTSLLRVLISDHPEFYETIKWCLDKMNEYEEQKQQEQQQNIGTSAPCWTLINPVVLLIDDTTPLKLIFRNIDTVRDDPEGVFTDIYKLFLLFLEYDFDFTLQDDQSKKNILHILCGDLFANVRAKYESDKRKEFDHIKKLEAEDKNSNEQRELIKHLQKKKKEVGDDSSISELDLQEEEIFEFVSTTPDIVTPKMQEMWLEMLQQFLSSGKVSREKLNEMMCTRDKIGLTPLMYAARCGHPDVLNELVANGIGDVAQRLDLRHSSASRMTAIHFACERAMFGGSEHRTPVKRRPKLEQELRENPHENDCYWQDTCCEILQSLFSMPGSDDACGKCAGDERENVLAFYIARYSMKFSGSALNGAIARSSKVVDFLLKNGVGTGLSSDYKALYGLE